MIIYIIFSILIVVSLYRTIVSSIAKKTMELNLSVYREQDKIKKLDEYKSYPYLVLLIPGLREQSIVLETIKHFEQFQYPEDRLFIIFVTTTKEERHKNDNRKNLRSFYEEASINPSSELIRKANNSLFPIYCLPKVQEILKGENQYEELVNYYDSLPTTAQLIIKEVQKSKRKSIFYHADYPLMQGGKPSQLNYAIDNFEKIIPKQLNECETYIGIYDFDSRPDISTGIYLGKEVLQRRENNKELPAMFQQIQFPFKDLYKITGTGIKGMLLRGNAILYLRHALGIELYRNLRYNIVNKLSTNNLLKAFLRPVIYGIGTGMFINLEMLKKINKFPEPQEDLSIGYRLSMLGKEIKALYTCNFVEPYDSYKQMVNAFSMTFLSSFLILEESQNIKKFGIKGGLSNLEIKSLVAKEWLECIIWLLKIPFFMLFYLLVFFLVPYSHFFMMIIIHVFIRFYIDMFLFNKYTHFLFKNYNKGNEETLQFEQSLFEKLILIITSPIQGVMQSLPPIYSLKRWFITKVLKTNVERTKTER
ncbi:hypothetical protein [Lysinibacillus sphaericus]|uniref:hypothetical protein n=1 Tax=Lysinibacillus sphaericus TaxID=1421 RepID=UPI001910A10B|nr:hypothetical protein [Lysinibacillus sphaericus]QPA52718.1 hypothetical protein INQ53_12400 [Lysinibacillus sphaericus]